MNHKIFSIVVLAASLAGCKKLEGQATINSRIQALSNGAGSKVVVIDAGKYAATMDFGKKTTKVILQSANQKLQFKIKTPADLKENGAMKDFSYSAAQLDQNFGMDGDSNTTSKDGSEYSSSRSCVLGHHEESYRFCYPDQTVCRNSREVCTQKPGTNGDGPSDFVCRTVCESYQHIPGQCETRYRTVTDYGTRRFKGYDTVTQTFLKVDLVTSNKNVLGVIDFAEAPVTSFTETWSGNCN